jgi:hypothetical protein
MHSVSVKELELPMVTWLLEGRTAVVALAKSENKTFEAKLDLTKCFGESLAIARLWH